MRNTSWSNNNWPQDFSDVVEPTVADIFEHREERQTILLTLTEWWDDFCRMSTNAVVGWVMVAFNAGIVGVMVAFKVGILALVLIASAPAVLQAQDDGRWIRPALRESARVNCEWWGNCFQHYRYLAWRERQARLRHYRQPVYHREATLHYRTPDRDERYDDRRRCRDFKRTVGDQHVSVEGAKRAADKAWIQMVRFYDGEVWMTLENAKGVKYMCSRSSVGETLGQTFSRCEIEARPCKAEKESDR